MPTVAAAPLCSTGTSAVDWEERAGGDDCSQEDTPPDAWACGTAVRVCLKSQYEEVRLIALMTSLQ